MCVCLFLGVRTSWMVTDFKERGENQRKDRGIRMLWEPLHTQFQGHKTGSGAFTIASAHTCHPPTNAPQNNGEVF